MSWMILPCLFVYLFVGLVISAIAYPEHRYDERADDNRVAIVLLWPFYLFVKFLFGMYDTIANGSKIISFLITKLSRK